MSVLRPLSNRLSCLQRSAVALTVCTLSACNEPTRVSPDAPPAHQTTQPKPSSTAAVQVSPRKNALPSPNTLLLAQAQFKYEVDAQGREKPVPQPASLLFLRHDADGFVAERLIDPDSRVYHKAACVDFGAGPQVLTIGATSAVAKLWHHDGTQWRSNILWQATFGGKWDRLRDFEIGDVTGDGRSDLVIGTHDQGVITVLARFVAAPTGKWQRTTKPDASGDAWYALEVYRKQDTFIHEIELADVDGDGALEFFATPSSPNKTDASQSGKVLAFHRRANSEYVAEEVASFASSHVKEILANDFSGTGKAQLYAAVEPTRAGLGNAAVEIRRYTQKRKGWSGETVARIEHALQARVLLAADLCDRGSKDLIVTTMKAGIWRLQPAKTSGHPWTVTQIDADSAGFEHAAGVADTDNDGKPELYVSADEQDEIRQYICRADRFTRSTIANMESSDLTWSIEGCSFGN